MTEDVLDINKVATSAEDKTKYFDANDITENEKQINWIEFDSSADIQQRLDKVKLSANPLLEAAQPLLRALADMPNKLSISEVEGLRELLTREVRLFQALCDKANLPWKHMAVARYCLCTALDEAANRTEWGGNGIWACKSLLITFEHEVDGGEKFFLLIGRMSTSHQEYIDVLVVLYRILGLGFEGRYSVIEDGKQHLDRIRDRILTFISGDRETIAQELSPNWHGQTSGKFRILRSIPVWVTACVLGLTLFGFFSWYKYKILEKSSNIETRIVEIGKMQGQVGPPVVSKALRLSVLLKDEVARGVVLVDEDDTHSGVTFKGDSMFVQGSSKVNKKMNSILDKVAGGISKVKGKVTVIGHTDSQPIHTKAFPNNIILSEKRAQIIANYLKNHGVESSRITVIGRGEADPVASNSTAIGRANNRRVEIVVKQ